MRILLSVSASLLFMSIFVTCGSRPLMADENAGINIIPKPYSAKSHDDFFTLKNSTVIYTSGETEETESPGTYLAGYINELTGHSLKVTTNPLEIPLRGAIILSLKKTLDSLGDEGYALQVTGNTVGLSSSKPAGIFYGIQSLMQLLARNDDGAWVLPCVEIRDKPEYQWRGMLLDCSRHFMSVDFIKRYIDLLAYHKMNVFHWHLTDDQGWRLEIKRYPLLTGTGAWRGDGDNRYGGYYTQEEVRDIVAYAKSRYVTVVPEIEMPGHATAAVAAYPDIFCTGAEPVEVETTWGIHKNLFCAGKEETFEFLQNVLTEVCELFPSEFIHIGGDEAKKDRWKECPDCQKRIRDEGIEDENALQGYFTARINAFMKGKGRRIIGWDEILEGGVSTDAVVQSWRGMEGALEGSKHGHNVISSPHDYTYLDYPMFSLRSKAWWMGITPLDKIYSFKPSPDELTEEQAALILGGECTMWSEYAPQPEIDQQVFPRLCAFSEVVWTSPEKRDPDDFKARLETHYSRLDALGVDYYKPDVRCGGWKPEQISETPAEIEWDIGDYITGNGHYRLTFDHEEGSHGITVDWAALLQEGVEISRDSHNFKSGKQNMFQTYRFSVDNFQGNAVYTLRILLGGNGGTDTNGSLWIKRFK